MGIGSAGHHDNRDMQAGFIKGPRSEMVWDTLHHYILSAGGGIRLEWGNKKLRIDARYPLFGAFVVDALRCLVNQAKKGDREAQKFVCMARVVIESVDSYD